MLPEAPIDGTVECGKSSVCVRLPIAPQTMKKIEVAHVPERVFDRAAEHPEINHVADEMHESAVQKERRDQRDRRPRTSSSHTPPDASAAPG